MTILPKKLNKCSYKVVTQFFRSRSDIKNINMNTKENVNHAGILLKLVIDSLVNFAPLNLAEKWDNVGLLVEPACDIYVKNILLTNDLTQDVMEEAVDISADLIISYHPLIFPNIKCVTRGSWKQYIVSQCLMNKIAVFSPHTTWDIVSGGVNDWLSCAFDVKTIKPVTLSGNMGDQEYIVTIDTKNSTHLETIIAKERLSSLWHTVNISSEIEPVSIKRFIIHCKQNNLKSLIPSLGNDSDIINFSVVLCDGSHLETNTTGIGRFFELKEPITIGQTIDIVKKYLNMNHLQVALARGCSLDTQIKTIAVCAGSGGSVLRDVKADLKLSGEASHHEILDSVHCGSSYILTHHSNSERGFLTRFKELLGRMLNSDQVKIVVSKKDRDPLSIM